jgi:hypothetical protein
MGLLLMTRGRERFAGTTTQAAVAQETARSCPGHTADPWTEADSRKVRRASCSCLAVEAPALTLPAPEIVVLASLGAGMSEAVSRRLFAMSVLAWVIERCVRGRISRFVTVPGVTH